jgi:hypothetical protein
MSGASPATQVLVSLAVVTFMVLAGLKKHMLELRLPRGRHPRLRGWRRVLRH